MPEPRITLLVFPIPNSREIPTDINMVSFRGACACGRPVLALAAFGLRKSEEEWLRRELEEEFNQHARQ